jgi:formylglycine-generating enzyme required for sulfatase activity
MRSRLYILSLLACLLSLAAEPGMVYIPGGEYQRGRTHKLPDDGLKWVPEVMQDDRPVRAIHVDSFYLDTHEVTNEQYAQFARATGHRVPYHWADGAIPPGKEKHPVVNVSWDDAAAYAKWAGKRLPTEAEWERACRGLVDGSVYPWGDRKPTKADAHFNSVDGPQPVGQCKANYFGLHDVSGNVWEWTADWYEKDYYAQADTKNPPGPAAGRYRVLRGGSWADIEKYLTCAYRSWARPAERSPNIGFRCTKSFALQRNRSLTRIPAIHHQILPRYIH